MDYRNTDRHELGAQAEEAFIEAMHEHGIDLEDHRGDARDTMKRFRFNNLWIGSQFRGEQYWTQNGFFTKKTVGTEFQRLRNNQFYVWHTYDAKHCAWARSPYPIKETTMGWPNDADRPDADKKMVAWISRDDLNYSWHELAVALFDPSVCARCNHAPQAHLDGGICFTAKCECDQYLGKKS